MFGVLSSRTGASQLSDHEKANSELLMPHATQCVFLSCMYIAPANSSCWEPLWCLWGGAWQRAGGSACGAAGAHGAGLWSRALQVPDKDSVSSPNVIGPLCPTSRVLVTTSICPASLLSEHQSLQTLSEPGLR